MMSSTPCPSIGPRIIERNRLRRTPTCLSGAAATSATSSSVCVLHGLTSWVDRVLGRAFGALVGASARTGAVDRSRRVAPRGMRRGRTAPVDCGSRYRRPVTLPVTRRAAWVQCQPITPDLPLEDRQPTAFWQSMVGWPGGQPARARCRRLDVWRWGRRTRPSNTAPNQLATVEPHRHARSPRLPPACTSGR